MSSFSPPDTERPITLGQTKPAASRLTLTCFGTSGFRRDLVLVGDGDGATHCLVVPEDDGTVSKDTFSEEWTDGRPFVGLTPDTERLAYALGAREAALRGDEHLVDGFATAILGRSGGRWREAVSTALLGDWTAPMTAVGRLGPDAVTALWREAEQIHRQLMPLWRRRCQGSRLLLLDTPLSDSHTLYDLLADRSGTHATTATGLNAQLSALLRALAPTDRNVVLAWTQPGVATWADAACYTQAQDPAVTGEQVRRKVRRILLEHRRRAAQTRRPHDGAPLPAAL
jgi:hypothetical protein